MLHQLRRQRSIFHLGEEGGDGAAQHVKSVVDDGAPRHHQYLRGSRNDQRREQQDAIVGLRILVDHPHRQHQQHARVVLKQMVLPTPAAARHRRARGSFLRACTLCRRELGPDKDVYMYRGDQGFCSEECRQRQILRDEARERDAAIKKRWRGVSSVQHHHGPRSSAAAPGRLMAVD